MEAPRRIMPGIVPPRKNSGETGPVPGIEVGLPGADTPHTVCLAKEGSMPEMGHREEISCGRNWPREAGTSACQVLRG
jgi:hypothetical protein